jgi:hypothetical protein
MAIKIGSTEFSRAKELEALGIPLDGEVLEKSQEPCRGLWIDQDPQTPHTRLFDTISGGTGVWITVWIGVYRIIRVSAVRLDIPWCKQIRWLEDPLRKAPAKYYYSFPVPGTPRFERDAVLNHQLRSNSKLFPGQLDGFLLGIGEEPIPDQYRDREPFEARLSIFDGRNNQYSVDLKLLVSWDVRHHQGRKAGKETVAVSPARRRSLSWVSTQAENRIEEPVT